MQDVELFIEPLPIDHHHIFRQPMMFRSLLRAPVKRNASLVRAFHSHDHPASNPIINDKAVETLILNKSLDYIPKYGFNSLCITQAIQDLKYSDSLQSALTASPTGNSLELQLMLHWLRYQRQQLHDHVLDAQSPFHSISDEYKRVSYLINKRLEYNAPIVSQLASGLSQLVVPYNMSQSLEELHNLSDDIAFYAGDMSNDFAWYSKRAGFSTIYVSSELYMLQDTSAGFVKTKEFVEEKVEAVRGLGNAYFNAEQWTAFNAISVVNLIRSQLLRG